MTDASLAGTPAPGLLSRIVGVIFAPRATFERSLSTPKVLGVILIAGLTIGLATGVPQLTPAGRQAALDAQVQRTERFTGRAVTDEQYAGMVRMAPISAYAAIVASPIFVGLGVLLFAGLYFIIFNVVLGGAATFKQVLAVTAYGNVIGALGVLLGAPVQYFQGTVNAMGPFTLGALVPMLDEGTFLARFLGFIGTFQIWAAIVSAIGFSVLYRRKAGNIVIGLLTLTAIFAAIGAAVVGYFSGR